MLVLLASVLISLGDQDGWNNCLYNNKSIACRRQFLCTEAPCGSFQLEWIDGLSDVFTLIRPGLARNIGYYSDSRGGEWILREYAGSFALRNLQNQNTIDFAMTLSQCRDSGLSDLCE